MSGIFGALVSALGFGTANVVAKRSLKTLTVPQTVTTCLVTSVAVLLPIVVMQQQFQLITLSLFALSAALSLGEVILYLGFHQAFAKSNATTVAGIVATYPLISLVYALVVLHEKITGIDLIAIVLLVIGTVVVSIQWDQVMKDGFHKKDLVQGLPWILFALVAHGVYFPILGQFTASGQWEVKLLVIKLLASLLMVIVFFGLRKQRVVPPKGQMLFPALVGVFEMIGWAGFSFATTVTSGQTAIIIAVLNSAALVTALFAYIWLCERISSIQYIGIGLIVASLTIIAL